MRYEEFIERIDEFVGHTVRITSRIKADGKHITAERYVWDNKSFGLPRPDSLIDPISVELLR